MGVLNYFEVAYFIDKLFFLPGNIHLYGDSCPLRCLDGAVRFWFADLVEVSAEGGPLRDLIIGLDCSMDAHTEFEVEACSGELPNRRGA